MALQLGKPYNIKYTKNKKSYDLLKGDKISICFEETMIFGADVDMKFIGLLLS